MWGHYLVTLHRSLTRRPLYPVLNVAGLAVGIAVFLVSALLVQFEVSFDRWEPDADNIYRLTSTYTFPGRPSDYIGQTSAGVLPVLLQDYPQIIAGTRMMPWREVVSNGAHVDNEEVDLVDPAFFKVLNLPLATGSAGTALARADNVVINQATALKYFGSTDVLGRTLTLAYKNHPRLYRVSGVLKDLPANSQLSIDILAPLTPEVISDPLVGAEQWGAPSTWTFVRLRGPAQATALAADLGNFIKRRGHDDGLGAQLTQILHLSLVALPALRFADVRLTGVDKPGVDAHLVYSLGISGLLTLTIAVLNYVNLATARSSLRAREISLRKVMGATRTMVAAQLLFEAMALSLIATLMGLALAELAVPIINTLGGASVQIMYGGPHSVLPWLALLLGAVGLGTGLYPALQLSRFAPAAVLASARSPGGGRLESQLRTILVCAQFVIAVVFTTGALVIASQARFLHGMDRGFERQGLILVDSFQERGLGDRKEGILDAIRLTPGVTSATTSIEEPNVKQQGIVEVRRPGQSAPAITLGEDTVGDGYLATYGAKLIAGRFLDRKYSSDDVSHRNPIMGSMSDLNLVLNERATRLLGFARPDQAIGQPISTSYYHGVIVGVLKDIKFSTPQSPVVGIVYRYSSQPGFTAAVRYSGASEGLVMERLRSAWSRLAPDIPFQAETADEKLSAFYVPEEQRARVFGLGAILAVLISCIGLYGLASFNTVRRIREIGIRKALGASTQDILRLLIGQFLRPVLLANLVAWPLAWLLLHSWLSTFDQRISLSPLYFLSATTLTLLIALSTVGGQTLLVARSEPAKALRHE